MQKSLRNDFDISEQAVFFMPSRLPPRGLITGPSPHNHLASRRSLATGNDPAMTIGTSL